MLNGLWEYSNGKRLLQCLIQLWQLSHLHKVWPCRNFVGKHHHHPPPQRLVISTFRTRPIISEVGPNETNRNAQSNSSSNVTHYTKRFSYFLIFLGVRHVSFINFRFPNHRWVQWVITVKVTIIEKTKGFSMADGTTVVRHIRSGCDMTNQLAPYPFWHGKRIL